MIGDTMCAYKVKKKKRFIIPIVIIAILLAIAATCVIYVSDYYRADKEAIDAFMPGAELPVRELDDGTLLIGNESAECGFVFYPGGKVEYTAYIPLMRAVAEKSGVLCALVRMPCNLAVLDSNAAGDVLAECTSVNRWYIGGHSLGGSMAASYASSHADDFEGVILLASYSTADLSGSELRVLSVYGSEDGVMNREKYEKNLKNLPSDFAEFVIDGGSHAYFGMYGEQDGDGKATITDSEQIMISAELISAFFLGK